MSSLEDQLLPERPRVPVQALAGGCMGAMLFVQFILICVMVGVVGIIAPELKSVLEDVNTMLPQMHNSIIILSKMLPDIKDGMVILDDLCNAAEGCQIP